MARGEVRKVGVGCGESGTLQHYWGGTETCQRCQKTKRQVDQERREVFRVKPEGSAR